MFFLETIILIKMSTSKTVQQLHFGNDSCGISISISISIDIDIDISIDIGTIMVLIVAPRFSAPHIPFTTNVTKAALVSVAHFSSFHLFAFGLVFWPKNVPPFETFIRLSLHAFQFRKLHAFHHTRYGYKFSHSHMTTCFAEDLTN